MNEERHHHNRRSILKSSVLPPPVPRRHKLLVVTCVVLVVRNVLYVEQWLSRNQNQPVDDNTDFTVRRDANVNRTTATATTSICTRGHGKCKDLQLRLARDNHHDDQAPFIAHHHELDKICSSFPRGATSSSIWRRHAIRIIEASIHPDDLHQLHTPWIKKLFELLPPEILKRGVAQSRPNHEAWRNTLHRISNLLYHNNNSTSNNSNNNSTATFTHPLQVVVFGGSVTWGRECHKLPDQVRPYLPPHRPRDMPSSIIDQQCAWPLRLQWLLDAMLGPNIVQVYNYAAGGTDTECALPKVQYRLYPPHATLAEHGPDVIINAYATNDNFFPEKEDGTCDPLQSKCLWNRSQYLIQQFLAAAASGGASRTLRNCHEQLSHAEHQKQQEPLVLYMDDYLGAAWNTILSEMQRHEVVQEQSNYQGRVGHVSSLVALSHLAWSFPITKSTTAAASNDSSSSSPDSTPSFLLLPPPQQVHFYMPGHVALAWIFAYALLQWTVDLCQDEGHGQSKPQERDVTHQDQDSTTTIDHSTANWITALQASSTDDTLVTPPTLHPELRFDHMSEWTRQIQQHHHQHLASCATPTTTNSTTHRDPQYPPCSFAFIAGPSGTHLHPGEFRSFIFPYFLRRDAWQVERNYYDGFVNSVGLVAVKPNASAILQVSNLTSSVQVITLQYLKSYGTKWSHSRVRFQLYIQRNAVYHNRERSPALPEFVTEWELSGYHQRNISVSHVHRLDIGSKRAAQVGDVIEVHMRLIGGTNFKMRALLMCNR